ncbi:MAG TPA: hypothetical protein VKW06_08840 [Candidatus Angelobacter sp.]|nr:hypothetical protein [Candidatus Angelobacter sp.]
MIQRDNAITFRADGRKTPAQAFASHNFMRSLVKLTDVLQYGEGVIPVVCVKVVTDHARWIICTPDQKLWSPAVGGPVAASDALGKNVLAEDGSADSVTAVEPAGEQHVCELKLPPGTRYFAGGLVLVA